MAIAAHRLDAGTGGAVDPLAPRTRRAATSTARCMPTNEELEAWICAVAAQQDRDAFVALFKHFAPRVKGYLVRGGTPVHLAEDLAQETMVAVWRRAGSFDPQRAALSTWIFTIARNLRIDHHRHAAAWGAAGQLDADVDVWEAGQQPACGRAGPDEQAQAAQCERDVRRAISELPVENALVLQLSFYEEQPHSAIARELGIPLGTVKSRIRLAVAQLRRKVQPYKP